MADADFDKNIVRSKSNPIDPPMTQQSKKVSRTGKTINYGGNESDRAIPQFRNPEYSLWPDIE